jgi:DNA-binding MarR family transcriptional regulator
MVLSLVPPVGWSPTFLSPPQAGTFEEVLEQVRATSRRQLRAQLAAVAEQQTIPAWAHHLADDTASFRQLCAGLNSLYAHLLGPYQEQLTGLFIADRTVRMRHLLSGGIERLLTQANPQWMRWNPPVLEIRMPNKVEWDLHLGGQGILLVPSTFGTRSLVDDATQPQPIVSYPAGLDQSLHRLTAFTPEQTTASPPTAVAALLGPTRSAVLHVIAEHPGCSTKEVATLAGIAPASASEHATILREAKLIHTTRHRNTALHSPSDLGITLLNACRTHKPELSG